MPRKSHTPYVDERVKLRQQAQLFHQAKWGRLSTRAQSANTVAVLASPSGQQIITENTQPTYPIYSVNCDRITYSSQYKQMPHLGRIDYGLLGIPQNAGYPNELKINKKYDGNYQITMRGEGRTYRYEMENNARFDLYFM